MKKTQIDFLLKKENKMQIDEFCKIANEIINSELIFSGENRTNIENINFYFTDNAANLFEFSLTTKENNHFLESKIDNDTDLVAYFFSGAFSEQYENDEKLYNDVEVFFKEFIFNFFNEVDNYENCYPQ